MATVALTSVRASHIADANLDGTIVFDKIGTVGDAISKTVTNGAFASSATLTEGTLYAWSFKNSAGVEYGHGVATVQAGGVFSMGGGWYAKSDAGAFPIADGGTLLNAAINSSAGIAHSKMQAALIVKNTTPNAQGAPAFVGQILFGTQTRKMYFATGTSAYTDWGSGDVDLDAS